ncbi:MerR family transcriptional regulator [Pyxidicoccus parkwayensis]|uniref:MerR family transcriptional regulator n=1 Tax=Pyxidicoccus parkwayensis TaxID=2813578 RepID=A0ABX7NVI0_9BACT|nr:MerR family transcriptional regulator [Pyxidicoccus parkwaysis]QSQ22902.1 MerR family transcriptional regulator [Pyxidicoccus parkwaysis]
MRIGELAKHAGLTVRTLHHYDAIGLLKPSDRTEGGYRIYGQADIARLHSIQAMRQLGLSLEDIGRLLDGGGATLPVIVEQQLRAVERQIEQATRLRTRLTLILSNLSAGQVPETRDWLASLRLMNTFDKYFSTDELKIIFGNWKRISDDMAALMAEVRGVMRAGVPPESLEVQPMAHRWMNLMGIWMEGDFDLIRRWGEIYTQDPSARGPKGPDMNMVGYIDRAIQLRLAAFLRHFTLDELKRLKLVPQPEWDALSRTAEELMQQDVPTHDARARALGREWLVLMNRVADHDAILLDKLLATYRLEPVVAASSALALPVRQYLERAVQAALDPIAA